MLTFARIYIILRHVIEAWLSLVERCVRDAEVACSNHVASILSQNIRPVGQAVKTTPSHGVNPGSIPGQVTEKRFGVRISFFFSIYTLIAYHCSLHLPSVAHELLSSIPQFLCSPPQFSKRFYPISSLLPFHPNRSILYSSAGSGRSAVSPV